MLRFLLILSQISWLALLSIVAFIISTITAIICSISTHDLTPTATTLAIVGVGLALLSSRE
jgi:uncharacterized protein involved in cysteine biosynthesis